MITTPNRTLAPPHPAPRWPSRLLAGGATAPRGRRRRRGRSPVPARRRALRQGRLPRARSSTSSRRTGSSPTERRLQHRPHLRAARALRRRAPLLHRGARRRDEPATRRAHPATAIARIAPQRRGAQGRDRPARRHHLHRPQGPRLARGRPPRAGAAAGQVPRHRRDRRLRGRHLAPWSRPGSAPETAVPLSLTRIVGTVQVGVEGAPGAAVHVDDEKAPVACTGPVQLRGRRRGATCSTSRATASRPRRGR